MNRWTRPVNGGLLALFVIKTTSGAVSFGVGTTPVSAIMVAVHGAAGTALLLLAPAKIRIARRGLRRPGWSRRVTGLALAALTLLAVASGLRHALGGFRPWLALLPMP